MKNEEKHCKWYNDEFCTNDKSPCVADYCPVVEYPELCKHREFDKDINVRSKDDTEIDVGMTDEEIVKALEICANWSSMSNCKDCPIGLDTCCENSNGFAKYALDLIRRLQYGYSSASKASEEWKAKYEAERKENAEQKAEIERLTEEQKNLDWYKMWHKKFKKEIDDLTLELETYRPTKLSGHGQCKCSNCGGVSWTDFGFSRYKGQTLCNKCLKEIMLTEDKQTVKDTAKEMIEEILSLIENAKDKLPKIFPESSDYRHGYENSVKHFMDCILRIAKEKGVEVK